MNNIYIEGLIRIPISIICGLSIGFYREARHKSAGIKTHAIVCVSSCIAILLSTYLEKDGSTGSAGRMAAAIIQGVGFLGAGMIFTKTNNDKVYGLTSAASIWLTSTIGMVCGSKYYMFSLICIAAYFVIVKCSYYLEKRIVNDEKFNSFL